MIPSRAVPAGDVKVRRERSAVSALIAKAAEKARDTNVRAELARRSAEEALQHASEQLAAAEARMSELTKEVALLETVARDAAACIGSLERRLADAGAKLERSEGEILKAREETLASENRASVAIENFALLEARIREQFAF